MDDRAKRPVVLIFKFLATSLIGTLVMVLVSLFAPPAAHIAALGGYVSMLAGLFVSYLQQEDVRERLRAQLLEQLRIPTSLAHDRELFAHYSCISGALCELARQSDPVLREFALLKLTSITKDVESLSDGNIVFFATETWRTVYAQMLRSSGLETYQSISWVRTHDYWQDQPGQQSMQVNFEMLARGKRIERILILSDELWPSSSGLPSQRIRPWIIEQQTQGIRLMLVRESELVAEPDLVGDVGIYGDRAVGIQELDADSRTIRFVLRFDRQSVKLARDRWKRLSLYTVAYTSLLDQTRPEIVVAR